MKLTKNLSRLSSFLGFLSFGILLYLLLVGAMFLALVFSFSGSTDDVDGILDNFIWLIALYLLLALVVLGTGPLWGKRLIGHFTATTPGYWKIAGLAVWLPFLLSIVTNAIVGAFLSNASPWVQLATLLVLNLGVILLASNIYYRTEIKARSSFRT